MAGLVTAPGHARWAGSDHERPGILLVSVKRLTVLPGTAGRLRRLAVWPVRVPWSRIASRVAVLTLSSMPPGCVTSRGGFYLVRQPTAVVGAYPTPPQFL